jgi:hypothetical protein
LRTIAACASLTFGIELEASQGMEEWKPRKTYRRIDSADLKIWISAMVIRVRIRRSSPKRKPRFFTLTAEPKLKADGPLRGHLDYVVFTADTANGLQMWHADRVGNFIVDFSTLVSKAVAIELVRELYDGRTVRLPGRYRLEQLEGRFGFPGSGSSAGEPRT